MILKNYKIAGVITAVAVISGLIAILNTSSGLPLWQWPLEAYHGMVFTIAWLTRAPVALSYLLATFIFVLIAAIAYFLGSWVYRKVSNMD